MYISAFPFSSRVNCYKSILHFSLFDRYQIPLLQRRMSTPTQDNISIEFIKPTELAQVIKDPSQVPGKDYLVVDVRDDDFEGGNIPNSINSPSKKFLDEVDNLVSKYNQVPKLVFTCALSQVRGPKCARIYKETLENKGIDQKIQVLQGGVGEWQKQHKNDPQLIENYDADFWDWD